FHFSLPRMRRIAIERKRKSTGGDATRRQEHRRIAGGPQRGIPSSAPEWDRRGIVRRHLRLRSAERRAEMMRIGITRDRGRLELKVSDGTQLIQQAMRKVWR